MDAPPPDLSPPDLPPLVAFTPLPPARNGIADYAAALLGALHGTQYAAAAACAAWEAAHPPAPGLRLLDPMLAHRHIGPATRVLHQIGNNAQHGFVLRALRRHPGVVTLHDPALLHLHEAMAAEAAGEAIAAEAAGEAMAAEAAGEAMAAEAAWEAMAADEAPAILAGMAAAPAPIGPLLARQRGVPGLGGRADHLLCDLAGEVLARARAVIVHAPFAAARLRALHGAAATDHVAVVPHPLPPGPVPARDAARQALGLAPETVLVVTAGFAARAKRFDWLLAALERVTAMGIALRWIHAGEGRGEAPHPADLLAQASPALRAACRITGWLEEPALMAHIAAADILVNLRFPSLGESSGMLARGLAAGVCCIVTDTAAHADLPRDAVLAIPPIGAVPALVAALAALARERALARRIGAAGQAFARRSLALPAIAAATAAVIEASHDRPPRLAPGPPAAAAPALRALALAEAARPGALGRALAGVAGPCRLVLHADSAAALAAIAPPALLAGLPPAARLREIRVQAPPAPPGLVLALDLPAAFG